MYKLCRNCDNVYNDEEHSSCPKCSGPIFHPPYPCATLQKEQTDKVAEKVKSVNPIIKFLCNLLGFAVGFVAIEAIAFVTTWLFIEVIGSVDFITSLLSWPVDYGTYAYSTIIVTEAFGGIYLCAKISRLSKSDFSYSCFLLALFRIIVWIVFTAGLISQFGFSFDFLWIGIMAVGVYGATGYFFGINKEM